MLTFEILRLDATPSRDCHFTDNKYRGPVYAVHVTSPYFDWLSSQSRENILFIEESNGNTCSVGHGGNITRLSAPMSIVCIAGGSNMRAQKRPLGHKSMFALYYVGYV